MNSEYTNTNTNKIFQNSPDITELNKQIFFPLTHLHKYRKESLLTETSTAYLNSVHPTNLRVNLNKTPSKKHTGLTVAFLNTSDVLYEYLKTLKKYSKYTTNDNNSNKNRNRKNKQQGVLINFNQHIAYNFNNKYVLLREENKNINIENPLNKPLLGLYPESNQNTPIPSFGNTHRTETEEPNTPTGVHKETPQDILLISNKLNILKGEIEEETENNRNGNNKLIKNSYKLLYYFFKSMYCLISKPVFIFTPDKVVIQIQYFLNIPKYKVFKWYSIFKYKEIWQKSEAQIKQNNKILNRKDQKNRNRNPKIFWKVAKTLIRFNNKETKVKNNLFNLNKYDLFRVFSLKFKLICEILNNKFNKPIELQLIRTHQPYLDSNILVNLLSLNIKNKKFKPNVKIDKLFQKRVVKNVDDYLNKSVNSIPTYLSGIKIRIGGRLLREHVVPKRTQKRYERGASSIGKVNFLDTASITNTNRKGSYTLKISSGQNFF